MMSRLFPSIFGGVMGLLLVTSVAARAQIALDPQFGESGVVLTELGVRSDEAAAIAVQPDGRIIVAGSTDNGVDQDPAVVRYLADGNIDSDFQFSAGHTIGSSFGDDGARALALNEDGTILVGGFITENGTRSGIVLRLLANGQLDFRFGTDGIGVFDSGATDSEISDIAVGADGRITAVGTSGPAGATTPLFVRFLADGTVDESFGAGGVHADTDISGAVNGLVLAADGGLIAGGYASDEEGRRGLFLTRYREDGRLDTAFGDQGRQLEFNGAEEIIAYDVALQADGQVVVAGEVIDADGEQRIMLGRFGADGSPDQSLADNGILVHDIGMNSGARAVAVLEDGTILASGYQSDDSGLDTIIVQLDGEVLSARTPAAADPAADDPSGAAELTGAVGDDSAGIIISELKIEEGPLTLPKAGLSASMLAANVISTDLAGANDTSLALAALSDGTVLSAGSSGVGEDTAIMVARFTGAMQGVEAVDPVGAVITQYYSIETVAVTEVTRVSALTGGIINGLAVDTTDCLTECEAACTGTAAEITACEAACATQCGVPTIDQRGVVFSVDPHPEFEADTGTDGNGSTTDGTDTTTDVTDSTVTDTTGTTTLLTTGNPLVFDNYFVRNGQTSDGSGTGVFSSDIDGVNPQTVYYVRAYALLSDGTVIYGNEFSFRTEDSCFIATAAFGSGDDFAVRILREFRDRFLKPFDWGRAFIRFYYHFSPPAAELIEQSPLLRLVVVLLLMPVVIAAAFMVWAPVLATWAAAGAAVCWGLTSFRTHFMERRMTERNNGGAAAEEGRLASQGGFTLIELLVVLIIIGILAGYIGPKIMGRPEEARRTKAALQIGGIETALKMYKLDNGDYPSTEQGLQSLVEPPTAGKLPPKWRQGGYLENRKMPKDPWGNDFAYLSPGVNGDFDLSSYGKDGEPGGEEEDADINNWEIE